MFDAYWRIKEGQFKDSGISVSNLGGFFNPFGSLSSARQQLKSPILMPLIDLSLALTSTIRTLRKLCETAVNLVTLDFSNAGKSTGEFFGGVACALYFAASAVFDTLRSALALGTRTLATAVSGVGQVASALLDCCSDTRSTLNIS